MCAPHVRFGSRDHFALTTIPSASSRLSPPLKCFNIYVSLLHHLLFKCDLIGLNSYQAHTHTHPLPCPIPRFTTTKLCRTAIKRYKGQFLALLTQYCFHYVYMIIIPSSALPSSPPHPFTLYQLSPTTTYLLSSLQLPFYLLSFPSNYAVYLIS